MSLKFKKPVRKLSFLTFSLRIILVSTYFSSVTHAEDIVSEQVHQLGTITVVAEPLNQAYQVNVGAFGSKNIMDVPLAIENYHSSDIAKISPRSVRDVLEFDHSVLNSSYGGGFDNFKLRGFAMDNFNTIRRDGLTLAPHYDVPMELIEQVDVLKGPSGFLYGINSPGGTINYIPKRPTLEPFTALDVQLTSLQGQSIALDHSDSYANGVFGYRLNAGYEKVGDFNHFGDLERKFVGLATDFRLSEQALLQLNMDWVWKSAMSDPLLRADQSGRDNVLDPKSFILPPRIDRRDALSPSWYRHKTEAYNIEAKFDYQINDLWTFITQANYSQIDRHGGYVDLFDIQTNGDIGYADLYQSRGEIFTTTSLQSYLAGNFLTGSIQHDMFIGASHKKFTDESPYWDFVESTGDLTVDDISVGNILNPKQPPKWNFGAKQDIDFKSSIQESSVFASDLLTLNDKFQFLLGGRYIWYKARQLSADALPQDKNAFVPTGAFIYRPTDHVMTYLSYSKGFEKGDYAPYNANNANQPTDAIESNQIEIGLKADIDEKFNLGLALFNIKRDASYLNTKNDYVSNGTYQHRGVELTAKAKMSNDLGLFANLAYLDTELKDVSDLTTLGKRSEGVPRWKGALGLQYDISAIDGLSVDSSLNYTGSRAVDAQNSGFIDGYTLWNAGLNYQTKISSIDTSFRIYAKNLTNKYYYSGVYYSGGLEVGRGREIFFSTNFKF